MYGAHGAHTRKGRAMLHNYALVTLHPKTLAIEVFSTVDMAGAMRLARRVDTSRWVWKIVDTRTKVVMAQTRGWS